MSFTDTEIQRLKRDDIVHEDGTCRPFICTTNPRPSKSRTHSEVWAISGGLVVRLTFNSLFHPAHDNRSKTR